MEGTPKILIGTLGIYESFNGFLLYGDTKYGNMYLANIGDGVDNIISSPDYDPNDDHDLAEAYGFTLVRPRNILGNQVWEIVD